MGMIVRFGVVSCYGGSCYVKGYIVYSIYGVIHLLVLVYVISVLTF
jgi:hypothetical protein